MLKPYKYLHYRFYAWQLKLWGGDDLPQFNALFFVSILVALNCYFVIDLISFAVGINILKIGGFGKVHAVVIYFVIVGFGYVILLKDGRFKDIAKQFNRESKGARSRNFILCILYVVATFVVAFGWPIWFPF